MLGFKPPVFAGTEIARTLHGVVELPVYEPVDIDGAKLRRLRRSLDHTIGTAATATGLTVADISALENCEAWVNVDAYEALLRAHAPRPDHGLTPDERAELIRLRAEVERCHSRLEIDRYYVVDRSSEDGFGRVDVPMADRDTVVDGIFCRDATIAGLRSEIEELIEERDQLRDEIAKIRERRFPIQGGPSIPWCVIALHENQAMKNHSGQSLERLAERGGLSPSEAVAVLHDRPWCRMDTHVAIAELDEIVRRYEHG